MGWVRGLNVYKKGDQRSLINGLASHEFDCQCRLNMCHFTLVSPDLLIAYQKTREEFGLALQINSGFRCQLHNVDEGGELHSYHTMGMAIDITPKNHLLAELDHLEAIARRHFSYVKRYENFIHCDVR